DRMFRNIAASLILEPHRITYLCRIESPDDAVSAAKALGFCHDMLIRRHIHSEIELTAVCDPECMRAAGRVFSELEMNCRKLRVTCVQYCGSCGETIVGRLKNKRLAVTAIERNEAFDKLFDGHDIEYPTCRFDTYSREFYDCDERCAFFRYVDNNKYLTADTLINGGDGLKPIGQTSELLLNLDELYSDIRHNHRGIMNRFCTALAAHTHKCNRLAVFDVPAKAAAEYAEFILPSFTFDAVERIIDRLKEHGIVSADSAVRIELTDSVHVRVKACESVLNRLRAVFCEPYKLFDASLIDFDIGGSELTVSLNSLAVKDFEVSENDLSDVDALLNDFAGRGMIYELSSVERGGVTLYSFVITSLSVKNLLTDPLALPILYCSAETAGCALFSDSALYRCGSDRVMIVTRGFRMAFVGFASNDEDIENCRTRISEICDEYGIQAAATVVSGEVGGINELILGLLDN
nr:hypothetical protein [Clostridia bacterium]